MGPREPEKLDRSSLEKAETALWFHSGSRALNIEVKFSQGEFMDIVDSWDNLRPEIKTLALTAYPEIAAVLLNKKLEKKE